jgi:transposase
MLEANAAMRSIVRRDTGEGYEEFLRRLAQESGIATPTREQLAKLDRKRVRKGSNADWVNPHDPEAGITKLKDGRTHLAYKAEHAVDLETGAVVAVTVTAGDAGDTTTILETLPQAGEHIAEVAGATANHEDGAAQVDVQGPEHIVADKGYHSNDTLAQLHEWEVRSYISEPSGDGGTGRATARHSKRCTATGSGSGASTGRRCCGGAENFWNAASRTPMRPEGCDACTCEGETMFSNGC